MVFRAAAWLGIIVGCAALTAAVTLRQKNETNEEENEERRSMAKKAENKRLRYEMVNVAEKPQTACVSAGIRGVAYVVSMA